MPMNNKIYTTKCKLKGVQLHFLGLYPYLFYTGVPFKCTETIWYFIAALKLCNYQCQAPDFMHLSIAKIPAPEQKSNGQKYGLLVFFFLQLKDQIINVPTLGRQVAVKFSRVCPTPIPPPTLGIDLHGCITTENNNQYSCKKYVYTLFN